METLLNFNNREVAFLLWLFIGLIFTLQDQKLKESFIGVINAFLNGPILTIVIFGLAWISPLVWFMSTQGLWGLDNLKTTVLWFIAFAIYSMFKIKDQDFDHNYGKELIRDSIGLTAILMFVSSFYSLPLWAEFILLPLVTLLAIMQIIAKHKKEYRSAMKSIETALVVIGVVIIGSVLRGLYNHPEFLFKRSNLFELLLPITLTIWYLPYLFVLKLFLMYELLGKSIRRNIKHSKLQRYARYKIFWHLNWDVKALQRLNKKLFVVDITNGYHLMKQIHWTKLVGYRDKYHTEDNDKFGWAPSNAKQFLASHGLMIKEYVNSFDEVWYGSKYKTLEGDLPRTTIEYSITGTEEYVQSLDIEMNIYSKENLNESRSIFIEHARELTQFVTQSHSSKFFDSLRRFQSFKVELQDLKLEFTNNKWQNSKREVVEYKLILEKPSNSKNL